jgi:hypothetical protein
VSARRAHPPGGPVATRGKRRRDADAVPLIPQLAHVLLNAPGSRYHGATGTVDAHELERVRGKDKALTLTLDDGTSTIAFGDELEEDAS